MSGLDVLLAGVAVSLAFVLFWMGWLFRAPKRRWGGRFRVIEMEDGSVRLEQYVFYHGVSFWRQLALATDQAAAEREADRLWAASTVKRVIR